MSARSSVALYGPQNATANGQTIGPADTSDCEYIAVQFNGAYIGTVAFEQSLDGVTWAPCALQLLSSTVSSISTTPVNPAAGAIYYGPCPGRLFRVRTTAFTSGSALVSILPIQGAISQLAFNTVLGSITPADAQGNPTSAVVDQAFNMAYNNTTWDRVRNAFGTRAMGNSSASLSVHHGGAPIASLNGVSAVATGLTTDNYCTRKDHTMQITGTGVGQSINFEINVDGATWVPVTPTAVPGSGGTVVGSACTTNGIYTISNVGARQVRANLTAITSGAVTATVGST